MAAPAPDRWKRIEDIFQAALDLPQDKRAAYVWHQCDGDEELRHEVEALLSQHEEAGDFIEAPALMVAPLLSTMSLGEHEHAFEADLGDSLIGQKLGPYRVVTEIGHGGM